MGRDLCYYLTMFNWKAKVFCFWRRRLTVLSFGCRCVQAYSGPLFYVSYSSFLANFYTITFTILIEQDLFLTPAYI